MNCYGSARQQLPALGRAVLGTIDQARGFYRAEGMTAADVAARIRSEIARTTDPRGRAFHGYSPQEIGLAFAWLKRAGFIARGSRGWRKA